ncbi:sugar phosphate isomerase/epimerase (plasmid) [Novosphingobium sp. THN1]|uniref:sugar phosphate isomerase/epimerase family protein n=1 Tax=Novosphingobium sp. THN1 TaxID=1016987 RepID=UPI000E4AA717|nr:TIM barrel protein [Novosphingobium sp. THN1]AXU21209.1 sugar phosphate isomerase/epimerase [Novosphingobium sp. THN1]
MNPISLASGVVPEFGPVETIEAARAGGFDMVGLWVDPAVWTPAHTRNARAALAATGLPLLDVEVIWLKPDSAMDDHRKVIDVGADLGARNVLCVSSDPDHARTASQLHDLCRHAECSGMRVALEFGIFTEVKDLQAALGILDRIDHPLKALLIDPIHVDRSGSSIAEIAKLDPALLPYAQFCDAPAERPDPADFNAVIRDAIDLREQCGEGALPLAALYQALPPGIPLAIELRSETLRDAFPHPALRAAAVAGATRRWLQAHP